MREACAEVFDSWITAGIARFDGIDLETARRLTVAMLCALEGAFVLARAQRNTEPLHIAGEIVACAVQDALDRA
jgi:hypothetical protein